MQQQWTIREQQVLTPNLTVLLLSGKSIQISINRLKQPQFVWLQCELLHLSSLPKECFPCIWAWPSLNTESQNQPGVKSSNCSCPARIKALSYSHVGVWCGVRLCVSLTAVLGWQQMFPSNPAELHRKGQQCFPWLPAFQRIPGLIAVSECQEAT